MALLVQTPRGTVSLPPQGFFQQQPSPFQSLLSPTGLPPRQPAQFGLRVPVPADLDSASLVVPTAEAPPPRSTPIPPSASRNANRPPPAKPSETFFARDPSDPFANPGPDPSTVGSVVGTLLGPPGAGAIGAGLGNLYTYAKEPEAVQERINFFDAFLDSVVPLGLLGKSVEDQANEIAADIERSAFEDSLGIDVGNIIQNSIGSLSPPPSKRFKGGGSQADAGFEGGGIGGTPGQDDTSEAPPKGQIRQSASRGRGKSSRGTGGGSYICTAAWDTGISAPETWSLNRRFGVWIRRNDPLAYEGYSVFGPWIADRIRDGKLRWIGKLKPRCWAYEMAQRSGKDTSGYSLGVKILNRVQRVTTRPLIRLLGWYASK